jgi:hypothetical protein
MALVLAAAPLGALMLQFGRLRGDAPSPATVAWFALVCLIVLKGGALLAFGPTATLDGRGYAAYADAIVDGTFTHVDLARDAIPITLSRPIGYPA